MISVLITGSGGLCGSSLVRFFSNRKNIKITGIDNNSRKKFFGKDADVSKNINSLLKIKNYTHYNEDIRNKEFIENLLKIEKFDAIIHTASNPSHDFPVKKEGNILLDYEINSTATLWMLECFRKYCSHGTFVLFSTNKVTGDNVNKLKLIEKETRYDYADEEYFNGINEKNLSIDNCVHSLFGCSKLAADQYTIEYGRYFNLKTYVLRGGCLTGSSGMAGCEAHGFLNFLCKSHLQNREYNVFGNKAKMVRDNIHSYDVASLISEIIENPSSGGIILNLGGGRERSVSHLEAFNKLENLTGKKFQYKYINEPRIGDHIVWITDTAKAKMMFPNWKIQYSLDDIFEDIIKEFKKKSAPHILNGN